MTPAPTRHRLRLTEPYPHINITQTIDHTGRATYRIRGSRVTGTLVIAAESRTSDQAIPENVRIQIGDGPENVHDHDRENLLVVNGVPLVGGIITEPGRRLARAATGKPWEKTFWLSRPTGRYTSTHAPEKTNRYASAVIIAVLRHWYTRPDRAELIRASARHTAARRRAELERRTIAPLREQIADLQNRLLESLRFAAELDALAAEHTHHDRYS